ncbi:MAG: HAMP domain-containing protein [Proteobacteria bacterium]|nr:HAMP domain-containing protein [Pseudomonadota bacterium]
MARLKRFLPRTLFGRALMIIVTPLVLLQLVAAYIFFERHWDTVGRHMAQALAGDVATMIGLIQAFPEESDQAYILWTANVYQGLESRIEPGATLPAARPESGFGFLRPVLTRALEAQLAHPFRIDTDSLPKHLIISVQLDDRVLHVTASQKRVFSSTTYIFIMWMVGASIVLLAIAIFFLRNQVRPIRRLARAAEGFGKGLEVPGFKPEGATEVRQAAAAFLQMRERIRRQIAQRTELLAGVSHDLRTPLTRMKLQLAMAGDDAQIASLQADVAEMEKMIDGYLAFARGEESELAAPIDLGNLLAEVVADGRRKGGDITLACDGPVEISVRPQALRRCFTNLVDNALRHGERLAVTLSRDGDAVEIAIDDDGPGIPEAEREEVFKAFYRLDASRNLETGGVGLGLTIARDVARSHGGDIVLEDAPAGGLRALVRLPV